MSNANLSSFIWSVAQIFDYGNTALEKRSIFYKRLLPLLDFGREREGIDLSKVVLTHHKLKSLGKRPMPLNEGDRPELIPSPRRAARRQRANQSIPERDHRAAKRLVRRGHDGSGPARVRESGHPGQAAAVQSGIKDILLNHSRLWEALREPNG